MKDQIEINIRFGFKYTKDMSPALFNRLMEGFIPYLKHHLNKNPYITLSNIKIRMERVCQTK